MTDYIRDLESTIQALKSAKADAERSTSASAQARAYEIGRDLRRYERALHSAMVARPGASKSRAASFSDRKPLRGRPRGCMYRESAAHAALTRSKCSD